MQNTWHHVAQGNQPKHTTGKKTRKSYQAGGLRATHKDQIGSTCKVWQSVLAVDLDDPVVSLQLDALPLGLPHDGAVWLHALHANAGGALASGNIPGRGRTVSGPDFQSKSLQNQKANINQAGAGLCTDLWQVARGQRQAQLLIFSAGDLDLVHRRALEDEF